MWRRNAMPTIAILAGAAACVAPGAAVASDGLVPHRAVYDLTLADRLERSGVRDISGRMVHEFAGSACDGYTVSFRFVARFDTDDYSRLFDDRKTTYEAPGGESFEFSIRSYIDSRLDRETRGTARHSGDRTAVITELPEPDEHVLQEGLFPTEHLIELLANAEQGRGFYETAIFDGSEAGAKVMTTTVVIGRPAQMAETDPEAAAMEPLGDSSYWPVSIAYFDPVESGGEEMPSYHIGFKLHRGGISRDLTMDYGEFALAGRLVELDVLERDEDCD